MHTNAIGRALSAPHAWYNRKGEWPVVAVEELKFQNGTSKIMTPELKPEEYEKRWKEFKKDVAEFIKAIEKQKKT